MTMCYDVTIGIPVYNVEKYIEKCLLSALNQTFTGNIEILIINDCSTDRSMDIINKVSETHPLGSNIKIIHQPLNQGVGTARNLIIEKAQGKYLFFLDSDDFITPDCIEILFSHAEIYQSQVVYGSIRTIKPDGEIIDIGQKYLKQPKKILMGQDALALFAFQDKHAHLRDYMVNILIQIDFLKRHNLRCPKLRFHEDVYFCADLVPEVKKAVILPDITYAYVIRHESLSNYQGRNSISLSEIEEYITLYTYVKNKNRDLTHKPYCDARCVRSMTQMLFVVCGILKNKNIITPCPTNKMLRNAMRHPLKLKVILKFKEYKFENLAFYLIGVLPAKISVATIITIGKLKHLL